ncbi:hypothetical protein V6N12_037691 [Hibiscus sabdariffa]|uniref:Uncharacterized protein n=1 Tax=Hibiscus sabdariffa TaxID=183260 RepID=A0ABR2C1J6_9ROSI
MLADVQGSVTRDSTLKYAFDLHRGSTVIGIWSSLVKVDFLTQFLTMDIKEWVLLNLNDPVHVVNKPNDWELLFGSVCWDIWVECNVLAFGNPLEVHGTVLDRSQGLQLQCVYAINTVGMQSGQGMGCICYVDRSCSTFAATPIGWVVAC